MALAFVLVVPILIDQVRQLVVAAPAELQRLRLSMEDLGRVWLGPSFPTVQGAWSG